MVLLEFITAISIVLGGNSYHFDRSQPWNENNKIQGIELRLKDSEYRPFIKFFDNSFNQPSKSIGFIYQKCTDGELKLCGGYGAGIMDGYVYDENKTDVDEEYHPNRGTFPYIAPYGSLEYKNVEFGIGCVPDFCTYELKLILNF